MQNVPLPYARRPIEISVENLQDTVFKNPKRKLFVKKVAIASTVTTFNSIAVDIKKYAAKPTVSVDFIGLPSDVTVKCVGYKVGTALDSNGDITSPTAITYSSFDTTNREQMLLRNILFQAKFTSVNQVVGTGSFDVMSFSIPFEEIVLHYGANTKLQLAFTITRANSNTSTFDAIGSFCEF